MSARPAEILLRAYNHGLVEHGDTPEGARWPNEADRRTRFDVMLDLIERRREAPVLLCDFACGTGELLEHIRGKGLGNISYIGADGSPEALSYARAKFSNATFVEIDISAGRADLDAIECDYLVANGLFTVRFGLSHDEMWSFLVSTVEQLWPKVRRGLAFNAMSTVVDSERDDLFHLPMDDAVRLLHRIAGGRVRIRADYSLYEYTVFAYRDEAEARPMPRITREQPVDLVQAREKRDEPVPVLRPLLPTADRLVPYLRRIDASRIYTNFGPLACELERRLAEHLAVPAGCVVSASSGTAALTGAILAAAGRAAPQRPLALVPAFTFVATAVAAEQCGYRPYLADIDAETWMLDPDRLADHPALTGVGVVVPVAPFGRPVPQHPWQTFRDRTGIPVVIDGAASFHASFRASARSFLGAIPVVLSLHATKGFGTGEGGAVVWVDPDRIDYVRQTLNFGISGWRDSRSPSTNGKMSEYHAAVGLAALDELAEMREAYLDVADRYRHAMDGAGLGDRFFAAPDIGITYALFRCQSGLETARVQSEFRRGQIDWRLWYGTGLQHQTYFAAVPRENLATTEEVAPNLLGLPMAPDLAESQIARVVKRLAAASRGRSTKS